MDAETLARDFGGRIVFLGVKSRRQLVHLVMEAQKIS